jgi:hypothetical protein
MATNKEQLTAHKEWNHIFGAYVHQYAFIMSVRLNMTDILGLDRTKSYLKEANEQAITNLNPYLNEAFSDMIADRQKLNSIVDGAADQLLFKIQNYIDATSIIFMHSILEASLVDLLQITLEFSRSKWLKYIDEKRVTFSKLETEGLEQLQNQLLQKCFNQLKNDTIMKKCERIFEICNETDTKSIMPTYKYNREKLEEIDTLRHNIVHGLKIEASINKIEEYIEYLRNTGLYFFHLISRAYEISVNMKHIQESLLQR